MKFISTLMMDRITLSAFAERSSQHTKLHFFQPEHLELRLELDRIGVQSSSNLVA